MNESTGNPKSTDSSPKLHARGNGWLPLERPCFHRLALQAVVFAHNPLLDEHLFDTLRIWSIARRVSIPRAAVRRSLAVGNWRASSDNSTVAIPSTGAAVTATAAANTRTWFANVEKNGVHVLPNRSIEIDREGNVFVVFIFQTDRDFHLTLNK